MYTTAMSCSQYHLIIPECSAHKRLDVSLTQLLPTHSRTEIQAWIKAGRVLVNGSLWQAKTLVKGGEAVCIVPPKKEPLVDAAEPIALSIIYEDEEVLVINKGAGMVVHPGAGNRNHTLLNALLHHAPALRELPRAGIVHRLDKDTSGLLVIAKTPLALKALTTEIKKRALLREYEAIVTGVLVSGGQVNAPIGRNPKKRKAMTVIDTGKLAISHYRIMERYQAHTHIKVRIETGRTHQIRVHMAYIQHALVGDKLYGGRLKIAKGLRPTLIETLRKFARQALHATRLGFKHPGHQEFLCFSAPLPDDMLQLITSLKNF